MPNKVALEMLNEGWSSWTPVGAQRSMVAFQPVPVFPAKAAGLTATVLRDARYSQLERRLACNVIHLSQLESRRTLKILRASWQTLVQHALRGLLQHHPLLVALHTWRQRSKQVSGHHPLQLKALHFKNREMRNGFTGWVAHWESKCREDELSRREVEYVLKRSLSRGWGAWQAVLAEREAAKQTMCRGLTQFRCCEMTRGFVGWLVALQHRCLNITKTHHTSARSAFRRWMKIPVLVLVQPLRGKTFQLLHPRRTSLRHLIGCLSYHCQVPAELFRVQWRGKLQHSSLSHERLSLRRDDLVCMKLRSPLLGGADLQAGLHQMILHAELENLVEDAVALCEEWGVKELADLEQINSATGRALYVDLIERLDGRTIKQNQMREKMEQLLEAARPARCDPPSLTPLQVSSPLLALNLQTLAYESTSFGGDDSGAGDNDNQYDGKGIGVDGTDYNLPQKPAHGISSSASPSATHPLTPPQDATTQQNQLELASKNFEIYHELPPCSVAIDQVASTPSGVEAFGMRTSNAPPNDVVESLPAVQYSCAEEEHALRAQLPPLVPMQPVPTNSLDAAHTLASTAASSSLITELKLRIVPRGEKAQAKELEHKKKIEQVTTLDQVLDKA